MNGGVHFTHWSFALRILFVPVVAGGLSSRMKRMKKEAGAKLSHRICRSIPESVDRCEAGPTSGPISASVL
jgi:hypothetical protein